MSNKRYKKIKNEAKGLYFSIGEVYCPALDCKVAFARDGWNHILRKGRKLRRISDQIRRFNLLKYALVIIESNHSVFSQNKIKKDVTNHLFWSLFGKVNGLSIKIVIRQKSSNSKKQFFSIYN